MTIKPLDSWDILPKETEQLQIQLAKRVKTTLTRKSPKVIAGADVSFLKNPSKAFAGLVLLDFPSLRIIDKKSHFGEVRFPYIPGLLSFREAPIILELFER